MQNEHADQLAAALDRNSEQLEKFRKVFMDWRLLLLRGVLFGFGGVLGATVVVSLIVKVLQPFEGFDTLQPTIERLTDELQKR